jgi:hypothetical protein
MDAYNPQPINTSDLPARVEIMVHRMASRIHDSWAHRRIGEGWTYGPKRDDENKKHPCLVPFEELPEEEKAYDVCTARTAVALFLEMGSN